MFLLKGLLYLVRFFWMNSPYITSASFSLGCGNGSFSVSSTAETFFSSSTGCSTSFTGSFVSGSSSSSGFASSVETTCSVSAIGCEASTVQLVQGGFPTSNSGPGTGSTLQSIALRLELPSQWLFKLHFRPKLQSSSFSQTPGPS